MSNFYGTEIKIWDGFGPVGNTEKRIGADYEQLSKSVFSCFQGQKNIEKIFENLIMNFKYRISAYNTFLKVENVEIFI